MVNHNSISEISELLDRHGIALKKRFGQNFLIEPVMRERIGSRIAERVAARVKSAPDAATVTEPCQLWEIGPGLGALTDQLLQINGVRLRLFEIDHGIIRILRERYGESVRIEAGDFLQTFPGLPTPNMIVGNLPYQSAGAMIPRIVESGLPVSDMVFLLQSEMVSRLVSPPGNKTYSAVSVLVQSHYRVQQAFSVPASAFFPRPRVDSAVALFTERDDRPDRVTTGRISFLARTAFGQRRKALRNTLRDFVPHMEICGIDPGLRPEQLAPAQFLALARACGADSEVQLIP